LVEKVDRIGRNQIYFFRFDGIGSYMSKENAAIVERVAEVQS